MADEAPTHVPRRDAVDSILCQNGLTATQNLDLGHLLLWITDSRAFAR